jgi:hypothetical protein
VHIESKAGAGTTVRAMVPLGPNGPDVLDPVAQIYSNG